MFINLSNHPMHGWDQKQLDAARVLGDYSIEYKFPDINPNWNIDTVEGLAHSIFVEVAEEMIDPNKLAPNETIWIHVMGEMTFVHAFIKLCEDIGSIGSHNIICVASTTKRIVKMKDDKKIASFEFETFRKY